MALIIVFLALPVIAKVTEQDIDIDKTRISIEKILPLDLKNPEVINYHKYFKKYLKNKELGQTIHYELEDYYGRKSLWINAKGLSKKIPLYKAFKKFLLPNGNYILQPLDYSAAIEYDKNNNIVGYIDIKNLKNSSNEFCEVFYEYKSVMQNNIEDGTDAILEKILFLYISRNNNKIVQFLYDKNSQILSYQVDGTLYSNNPNTIKTIDLSNYTINDFDKDSNVKRFMDILTGNPFTGLPALFILSFPPVREKLDW